ncbi:Gfo/Idh/MocA family protein [Acidisoma sp. C75]
MTQRRIRLGMVGGGPGSFIGPVHRLAARIDDRYDFVAGAFSSDPAKSRAAGEACHIDPARAYPSWQAMVEGERARDDRIDAVAIVTPNNLHYAPAKAFLEAGFHVICDKPLTMTAAEATELVAIVRRTGLVFGVTHTYAGYPMVRQARAMVAAGELGDIRVIHVEYAQSWLTEAVEKTGLKQAVWRTDPAQSGGGGCLGDIGTHAYHIAHYVTGLRAEALAAELSIFAEDRKLDDNVHILLRYEGGARGMLWASQVAPGEVNGVRLRVFGAKGGLSWHQEQPNELIFTRHGEPPRHITRGGPQSGDGAAYAARVPAGHPEGYLEAFAQLYTDAAEQIVARWEGRAPAATALLLPTVEQGEMGMKFIEAALESNRRNAAWVGGL